jgi:hypothetical protein
MGRPFFGGKVASGSFAPVIFTANQRGCRPTCIGNPFKSDVRYATQLLWKAVEALNVHEDIMSDIEWAI